MRQTPPLAAFLLATLSSHAVGAQGPGDTPTPQQIPQMQSTPIDPNSQRLFELLQAIRDGIVTAPEDLFGPLNATGCLDFIGTVKSMLYHWQGYVTAGFALFIGYRSIKAVRDQIELSRKQSAEALDLEARVFHISAMRQIPDFIRQLRAYLDELKFKVDLLRSTPSVANLVDAINYSGNMLYAKNNAPNIMRDSRGVAVSGNSMTDVIINIMDLEQEIANTHQSIGILKAPISANYKTYIELLDQIISQSSEILKKYEVVLQISRTTKS